MSPEPDEASAALGDKIAARHPRASSPIFFDERITAAITGKSFDEQLTIMAGLIQEAEDEKSRGFGPPQSDITAARRKWLALYETHYARAA